MDATKFAVLIGLAREVVRSADPRARALIERVLMRALRLAEDRELLSTSAAVAHERPAGLLNGVSPVSGGSPDAEDVEALLGAVRNGEPDRPFFIASLRGAAYLASLRSSGVPIFPAARDGRQHPRRAGVDVARRR